MADRNSDDEDIPERGLEVDVDPDEDEDDVDASGDTHTRAGASGTAAGCNGVDRWDGSPIPGGDGSTLATGIVGGSRGGVAIALDV